MPSIFFLRHEFNGQPPAGHETTIQISSDAEGTPIFLYRLHLCPVHITLTPLEATVSEV